MHDVLKSNIQNPSQNFAKTSLILKNPFNFEKPQIFQQTPKARSQKMKCIKKWMRKSLTREKKWSWDQRTLREEVWSEREVFWEVRGQKVSREIEKSEAEIALTL